MSDSTPRKNRKFSYTDTQRWAVKDYTGRLIAGGFDGYKSAAEAARSLGGTPVRA